jgi:hypothetical protein
MRHMPNFTPMHLSNDANDPHYLRAIKAFRRWAGPHVHLGEAGVIGGGKEDELLLHKIAIDRIIELHLTVREMYGSALSYTAKPPVDAVPSSAGFVEVIRVHMRIDPGSVIWITGLSAVKEDLTRKPEWRFQLTPQARELAIASFLESNGVDTGVDVFARSNAIEAEGDRLAALAGPCLGTQ